jgi:hypothetical protein
MDGTNSEAGRTPGETTGEELTPDERQAQHAADNLRGQIAALRQQVRHAQDTLRDHERRRREGRRKA